jgi:hypothetical protein
MTHHAHTNQEEDPDIYARGSFLGWIFLRLPCALLNYFNRIQQYRDCDSTVRHARSSVLLGSVAAGFWRDVCLCGSSPGG